MSEIRQQKNGFTSSALFSTAACSLKHTDFLPILQVIVRLGQPRQGSCWSTSPTTVHTWPLYSRLSWEGVEYTEPTPQETKPATCYLFLQVGSSSTTGPSLCLDDDVGTMVSTRLIAHLTYLLLQSLLQGHLSICKIQQLQFFQWGPECLEAPDTPHSVAFSSTHQPVCLFSQWKSTRWISPPSERSRAF